MTAHCAVRGSFPLFLLSCILFSPYWSPLSGVAFAKADQAYEHTLIMRLEGSEADSLQALRAIVNDQIIHGTQQYAKEKVLYGAHAADGSRAFSTPAGGKVFYKVADKILAPQNFHESESIGTITVRYILQPIDANSSSIQIDAVFVEDDRRRVHRSEGVVESAEYAEILKKLQAIQAEHSKPPAPAATPDLEPVDVNSLTSFTSLEERLHELRHRVELRSGQNAVLRSAPYRGAVAVQTLSPGTELLVMVITRYWYGVETKDGHRGWVHHGDVESIP